MTKIMLMIFYIGETPPPPPIFLVHISAVTFSKIFICFCFLRLQSSIQYSFVISENYFGVFLKQQNYFLTVNRTFFRSF